MKLFSIFLSIISVFTTSFSQISVEKELKKEISAGNYESPYIVSPFTDITINGVSAGEYSIIVPDEKDSTLYSDAGRVLQDEIYKACKIKPTITNEASEHTFIIEPCLNDTDTFSLEIINGNVHITGSKNTGISRGIRAFFDKILSEENENPDFNDGYKFTKTFTDYVKYEDFGAAGDGVTDDMEAIVKTHEYANNNNLSVFADEASAYYIGGADKTAYIKTDTDWSTARFVIDDTNTENRNAWVFSVSPSKGAISITDKISSLSADAENIGTSLESDSLVVLTDSNVKRYIRKGGNQNSGSSQADVILVDKDGNISPDTPLIWDFDTVTAATAYPADCEKITVSGGIFTTIANNAPSEYNYYSRGIQVRRSNTVIDCVYHDITNEGKTGAPYSAFISISNCSDVTVRDCTFTGHKKYTTTGSAGSTVSMGTYDINASTAVNTEFINCKQTNDITDTDYWGIAGSNYCKNLTYDGCALSRFDAHQGVYNATIKNSVLGHHGIKLIGHGTALIENTTVLSDSFVDLREDYGSTWNGNFIIRNCSFYPTGISSHIIRANNSEDHNFGYTCYLPQKIEIDGFYVHRGGINYLFNNVNPRHITKCYDAQYPVVATNEIYVNDFNCLFFGNLYVSLNSAMFDVKIQGR